MADYIPAAATIENLKSIICCSRCWYTSPTTAIAGYIMEACLRKLSSIVDSYFKNVAVGLYTLLNRRSLIEYHMRFADLVIRNPKTAFKLLATIYSLDSALIVMRNVLTVLGVDPVQAEQAIRSLAEGDEKPYKRLVEDMCRSGRVKSTYS